MIQTQGQRGDLHQNSHPYKINRERGIELLAESMDANQELASDDPWAPLQISVGGPSSYIRDEFL